MKEIVPLIDCHPLDPSKSAAIVYEEQWDALIHELRALRRVASISKDVSESRLDCDTNSLTGEHIRGCTKCDLDQALAEWRKLEGEE